MTEGWKPGPEHAGGEVTPEERAQHGPALDGYISTRCHLAFGGCDDPACVCRCHFDQAELREHEDPRAGLVDPKKTDPGGIE
jgi:hypothetical protein